MKKITSLLLALFAFSAIAQEHHGEMHEFHILASKGENFVNRKSIGYGHGLTFNDTVFVGKNAYVAVLHKSGYCIELKEEGVYSTVDLAKQTDHNHTGVTTQYSEFVLEHFTKKQMKQPFEKMGKVNQDLGIKVFLPKQTEYIFEEIAEVHWMKNKNVKKYKISISNKAGKELYTTTTSDTLFSLNMSAFNLGKEHQLLLKISDANNAKVASDVFNIHLVSGDKASHYESVLNGMRKELHTETALGKVLLASYCEHHKLYAQAVNYFEDATLMQPEIMEYETLYQQFLHRMGILF
jgi:hypothetical protein